MANDETPALATNALLNHYRIVERIGAGGMGVVYKAIDTTLNRAVALKVLRPELLHDDGRSRLEREARALASLNDPRIAAIHGLEESQGTSFLVLEYVPGQTLADRLHRGRLSIRNALLVMKQIAEALEAAHAAGIVHRDLKPANIKLSDDGHVKVLDFGLAKSVERLHAQTETIGTMTATLVRDGTVAGTAAYMSPEQACGKPVDSRTDIWSFGCVLYEALTGTPAFRGATVTEILAAVIEGAPDWQPLPADTPAAVVSLLHRCLRKDPQSRLRDIGDARIELDDALIAAPVLAATGAGVTRRTAIGALAGATVGAAATAAVGIRRWNLSTPRHVVRIPIALPDGVVFEPSLNRRVAISSDGARIAYAAKVPGVPNKIYLRALGALESQVLGQGDMPFFSPNSQWLGFFGPVGGRALYHLRKISLGGGAPVTLSATESQVGAAWADDDTIYFVNSTPGGVLRIPAAGGQPRDAATIDFASGERTHRFPCVVPGAHTVLFTASTADAETYDDTRIVGLDTRTGRRKILVEGGTHPRYSPSGHLVYARGGSLLAVRFDPERLAISGRTFTVLEGVLMSLNSGSANFDISASGDLIYVPGIADKADRTLVWVDRSGKTEPFPLPARSYLHPRISPDGRQLAIEIEGPNHDFYTYDFARAVLTKMTTDGESHWPVWSPDGAHVAYRSGHMGTYRMWRMPADRSGASEQVVATGLSQNAESWSPDGHSIAYTAMDGGAGLAHHGDVARGPRVAVVRRHQGACRFAQVLARRPLARVLFERVRHEPRRTSRRFRGRARRSRYRAMVEPIRSGAAAAENCTSATATR